MHEAAGFAMLGVVPVLGITSVADDVSNRQRSHRNATPASAFAV
jgi:hypothetical protein